VATVGLLRPRKIKVRRYSDSNRPHLKFVVNYREAGKRKRSFFEKEAQAKSFAAFKNAELQRNGVEGAEFPTALRVMAQDCVDRLKAFGRTIADATEHYVAHLRASERSCTVKQLLAELLDAKESKGVSRRHLDDLRQRAGRFAASFGERIVATITGRELEEWLDSLNVGPQTHNHYRNALRLAFNFAVRRGYASENPAVKTEKANVLRAAPGILTVTQAARLLEIATPNILPHIAIGLFAGLRRAEIERLDWSEVDFESGLIEVKAAKSKTAQRRFVTMQPNLREWLLPVRKHKGNVTPEDFNTRFVQARLAAGIKKWPENALRHSFASYHLAHFKNAASTALDLGHHDSRITFAHYRELVKPKEAERFWNIKPVVSAKVVPLVAQ
jgi:integrase